MYFLILNILEDESPDWVYLDYMSLPSKPLAIQRVIPKLERSFGNSPSTETILSDVRMVHS